jgi:hypothetical protein
MPGLIGFRLNNTIAGINEIYPLNKGHKDTTKTGSPVYGDQYNTHLNAAFFFD